MENAHNKKMIRGVYGIPPMQYNEDMSVDLGELRSIIEFCVEAGTHGIAVPLNVSEHTQLDEKERLDVIRTAVRTVNGRVPVVVGVSSPCTCHCVRYAQMACAEGADFILAMPPYIFKGNQEEIMQHYMAIDMAVDRPLIAQNSAGVPGTPMSAGFLADMLERVEHLSYIKEESELAGHVMSATFEQARQRNISFDGIIGGKAGRCIIEEYKRGSCGNMPACDIVDVQAKIWNAMEAGNEALAREMYNKVLPLLHFEILFRGLAYREVLKARGIISNTRSRIYGAARMDDYDREHLKIMLEEIQPYFAV